MMDIMRRLLQIPSGIWVLGIVSMLTDISSELVASILPLFMITTLGLSVTALGTVEGVAEAIVLIMYLFSGIISDISKKRKPLVLTGYGIAAFAKTLFPFAHTLQTIFAARIIDRIGKGIRNAPRNALIGDICPPDMRGSCFGLRQALDTVGAFVGPLTAVALLTLFNDNMRIVLLCAAIPAIISVMAVYYDVHEPEKSEAHSQEHFALREITQIEKPFWLIVVLSSIIHLTRISEAFLLLNAHRLGMHITYIPFIKVVMNSIYALVAYPAGALSDRVPRIRILIIGILFLIISMGTLAWSTSFGMLFFSVIAWGIYMGLTEGILSALIVDSTTSSVRGTAFGIFNFVAGICVLIANIGAGIIWHTYGATYVFGILTIISIVALTLALVIKKNSLTTIL